MVQMYWQWALHHSVKQLIKLLHLPVARNEFCLLLESTLFNKISHNTLNIHDWLFHSHRHLILGWNRFQHLFIPNISLHKSCHHYVQLGNFAAQNFRHDIQNFLAYINVTFIYAICVLMYAPLSLLVSDSPPPAMHVFIQQIYNGIDQKIVCSLQFQSLLICLDITSDHIQYKMYDTLMCMAVTVVVVIDCIPGYCIQMHFACTTFFYVSYNSQTKH